MVRNILIVSQVIQQWYVDVLTCALGEDVHIDIITGSDVAGNVIKSPEHDPRNLKSRLICWVKHYNFVKKWADSNRSRKYDLIFATSNPPINSSIGLMLKKKFKAPFVYMNWDLYPQTIEKSISNLAVKLMCNEWHKWNNRNYPKIDRMLTIGNVIAESLNSNITKKIPIDIIPIAVDTKKLKPINKNQNPFCKSYRLEDKFVVLYSGKMGRGHNIEIILDASLKIKEYKDIKFVFIGNGEKYTMIENFISEHNSENILLLPLQSDDVFSYSMACGDIGIVSQESSMAHLFMPSKTYSMMSCGEAIIGIGTDSDDLYNLISETAIGETVTDDSCDTLVEKILSLYHDREKLNRYKNSARYVAERCFSQESIEQAYSNLFKYYI